MVEVWDGRESGDEEQARGNRKPVDTKSNLGRSQIVRMSSHTQLQLHCNVYSSDRGADNSLRRHLAKG